MPTLTSASSDLFKAVYFEAKTFAYCPDLDKRQSYRTYFDSKDVKGDYVEAIDVLAASGIDLEQLEHLYKVRLGSVAGPVIQATGRSEFEDGLGSGDFVSGCSYHMRLSVRTRVPDHTMQTKFQSQRPSDVETPVSSI
jgi:hypothetical protein